MILRADTREKETLATEVFIVHGHSETLKQTVARFVERLKLTATILHEVPSLGRTIVEKFEESATGAGFAIILLTPDDVGGKSEETPELRPRARQNVVFEHGFFIGKLGRKRVVALRSGDVEIPSDLAGVVYVDTSTSWELAVAREMRAAGLPVDLNDLV